MAKNVTISGTPYANVASVKLPLTADPETFAEFFDTDSGDAAQGDILSGKKAWVAGAEITGTIATKTSDDMTVSGKTVTAVAGYYATNQNKAVTDGSVTPNVTASGDEISDAESDYPITITPKATVNTSGYVSSISDGSAVTKYIQTESKSADPTTSSQDVTPTSGKLLHKVTVNAVSLTGDAVEANVVSGKTFYSNSLTQKTGTLTVPTLSLTSGVLTIS